MRIIYIVRHHLCIRWRVHVSSIILYNMYRYSAYERIVKIKNKINNYNSNKTGRKNVKKRIESARARGRRKLRAAGGRGPWPMRNGGPAGPPPGTSGARGRRTRTFANKHVARAHTRTQTPSADSHRNSCTDRPPRIPPQTVVAHDIVDLGNRVLIILRSSHRLHGYCVTNVSVVAATCDFFEFFFSLSKSYHLFCALCITLVQIRSIDIR